MKHHWVSIEVGNWYTEYECTLCKELFVEEPDGGPRLPVSGCNGSGETSKMSYRCVWGVTIKQRDGNFHVVNEEGEVMAKFTEIHKAYNHISITDEAWVNEDEGMDESASM